MIYKEFEGKKLSALGMGCMRFPTYGEDKTIVLDEDSELAKILMGLGGK